MDKRRLPFMQAMRAIAALLVVAFHSARELEKHVPGNRFMDFFGICDFGVDIFFIISGFIMYYVTFGVPKGKKEAGSFLLKRINRIVPMYWLGTTLFILPLLLAPSLLNRTGVSVPYVVSSYAFLPWQRPGEAIPSVTPVFGLGWTLNFEMLFYFVFAILVALKVRRVLLTFALLFGSLCLLGCFVDPAKAQLFFWTRSSLLEFVAGVGIAVIYCQNDRKGFLPVWAGLALLAIGIAAWVVSGFLLPVHDTIINIRGVSWGLAAALIVGAITLCEPLAAAFPSKPTGVVQRLGDASFSLYLCHLFVVRAASIVLLKLHLAGSPPLFILGNIVTAALASLLVYRFVERPLTKMTGGLLLGKKARAEKPALQNASV